MPEWMWLLLLAFAVVSSWLSGFVCGVNAVRRFIARRVELLVEHLRKETP